MENSEESESYNTLQSVNFSDHIVLQNNMSINRKWRRKHKSKAVDRQLDQLTDKLADKVVDGHITLEELKARISDKSGKIKHTNAIEIARNLFKKKEILNEKIVHKQNEIDQFEILAKEIKESENLPGVRELAEEWFKRFGESDQFLQELVFNVNSVDPKMKVAMLSMALEAGTRYSQAAKFAPIVHAMLEDEIKLRVDQIKAQLHELRPSEQKAVDTIVEKINEFLESVNGRTDFLQVVKQHIVLNSQNKENSLAVINMILSAKEKYSSIKDNWWGLLKIKRELEYEVNGHAITTMEGAYNFVEEFFHNPELGMVSDKESCFQKLYEIFQTIRQTGFANRFPGEPEIVAQRIFTALLEKCDSLPLADSDKDVWRKMCDFGIKWYKNEPGVRAELEMLEGIAIESVAPEATSPNNLEIRYMSFARLENAVNESRFLDGATFSYFTNKHKVQDILYGMSELSRDKSDKSKEIENFTFAKKWRESGFARIEVSHKLAAALALTDTPVKVESPWAHWSLIIPTDMFKFRLVCGDDDGKYSVTYEGNEYSVVIDSQVERIWCEGCDPKYVIYRMNFAYTKNDEACDPKDFPSQLIRGMDPEYVETFQGKTVCLPISFSSQSMNNMYELMKHLVKGICLCVNERKQNRQGNWGSYAPLKNGKKRKKGPPGAGERYVIGRSISIDLREELNNVLSGRTRIGSSPKVQFLVRGHWRNQACGKGYHSHKRIWIEPYWKGDEEARVLLRPYEVDNG